jgi:hypothetical protein
MADWKQITARIRRAKGSKDPAGQLSNLFQKTRDAMVAFELARHFETSSQNDDATKWYAISWQRFRRGDWKSKAQEAITRLGGTLPAEDEVLAIPEIQPKPSAEQSSTEAAPQSDAAEPSSETDADQSEMETTAPQSESSSSPPKRNRRRGRRGGRNRRKGATAEPAQASSRTHVDTKQPHAEVAPPRVVDSRSMPRVPVEATAEVSVPGVKGRFGDPGLSSRLSLLEMQFRRLLTCSPAKLDHADKAPAGPGVFVLTDDDMTTYYYVEACDTLRIAIANMARGGANRRTGVSIKPLLADHLGIPEARVSKYLADHCVVRWLQLDEGAEHFAHFTIAVLRPILNSQS